MSESNNSLKEVKTTEVPNTIITPKRDVVVVERPIDTTTTVHAQLEALAIGDMREDRTKTVEQANAKIFRYGDPLLEHELDDWLKSGEENHTKMYPLFVNGESSVNLIGTVHTSDQESTIVTEVASATSAYIEATPPEKRLVMVEGFHDGQVPQWKNFTQAVKENGEMGACAFIAQSAAVEVISPEIPQAETIAALKQEGIPADTIASFYILRGLPSIMEHGEAASEKMAFLLYKYAQAAETGWVQSISQDELQRAGSDASVRQTLTEKTIAAGLPRLNASLRETVSQWYASIDDETKEKIRAGTISTTDVEQKVFAQLLTLGDSLETGENITLFQANETGIHTDLDKDTITYLTKPGNEAPDTALRNISRIDNEKRDEHLLQSIIEVTKKGKNPLIVFGGTHAIKIAPALLHLYPKTPNN